MSTWQGPAALPPRLHWIWLAIRNRIDDASIEAQTKPAAYTTGVPAAGSVPPYRDVELVWLTLPRGDADRAWARIVIVPVTLPFEVQDQPGREVILPWLVRVDTNVPAKTKADPFPVLEILQRWAFQRLHGWKPTAAELETAGGDPSAVVRLNAWRETKPQTAPLYDPETGLYYTSSEFRMFVESGESAEVVESLIIDGGHAETIYRGEIDGGGS